MRKIVCGGFASGRKRQISNLSHLKMNHLNSKNSQLEVAHVDSKKVSCQGEKGNGSSISGHPLVYLNMGKNDFVVCPYCSKYFTTQKKTGINSVMIGIKTQIKDEQ